LHLIQYAVKQGCVRLRNALKRVSEAERKVNRARGRKTGTGASYTGWERERETCGHLSSYCTVNSIRFDMFNVLGGNWDPTDKISVQ